MVGSVSEQLARQPFRRAGPRFLDGGRSPVRRSMQPTHRSVLRQKVKRRSEGSLAERRIAVQAIVSASQARNGGSAWGGRAGDNAIARASEAEVAPACRTLGGAPSTVAVVVSESSSARR